VSTVSLTLVYALSWHILSVFLCSLRTLYLQGISHSDLKPENIVLVNK
jgi:serine/threonine protein kinase